MAKLGGKLLIKYRDPVAASFSSKDIVLNVQTGTLFYKRNRRLFALRGTPDNFDLVVFPGQSTNQQILINDSSQEDGSPIMEGTDQFRFKLASATCGCANYFHIGAETLTHFSGSVRVGEHLPSTCNILDSEINPALKIYGNVSAVANAAAGMSGHITASGNIWSQDNVIASNDLYGTNTYIHDSLLHRGNTDTKLTFGIDTINLYSDGNNIATVSSGSFTINDPYDLYIPGTDTVPAASASSGTSVLVIDNSTGQVYSTGSYVYQSTFKQTGQRSGNSAITGSLTLTSHLTASANISASGKLYGGLISSSKPNVVFYNNTTGELTYATSESLVTSTFKATGQRTGDSSIDGNLTVTGTITAQEFHTEFVSSSIIFTSGSTQFGNSADDIHIFSGSINVKDEGHITASGNISASGTVTAEHILSSDDIVAQGNISASGLLYSSASLGFDNISIYNSSSGQYFYTSSQGLSEQLDTFKQTGLRTGDGYITGNITGGVNIQVNGGDPENYLAGALNIGLNGRPSELGDDVSYFRGSLIVGRHLDSGVLPDNRIPQGTAASLIVGQGNVVSNQFANSIVMGIFNSGSGLANFVGGSNYNKGLSDVTMVFGYGNHNEGNDGGIVLGAYNHISATSTNGHHAIGTRLVNSGSKPGSIVLGTNNAHGVTDAMFTIGDGHTNTKRRDLLVARSGSIQVFGNITASENISASGEVIAASAYITNITASRNISASGTIYGSNFRTSPELSIILTGTVTSSNGSTAISGSGTAFSTELNVGDAVKITSESVSEIHSVASITSNTILDLDSNWTGGTYTGSFVHRDDDLLSIKDGDDKTKVTFTKSGDISASGHLYISASNSATLNLAFYNTDNGELTYATTSSFLAGLISSSTQIASDISGSWQGYITGSGILSSSIQIATDISGAIDAATGSLLSSYTFLSSSTQIASDISGSWQGQNFISSSGEIAADISGSWQGQNFISASQTFLSTGQRNGDSAITGSLTLTTHLTASGNISASGEIIANKYYADSAPIVDYITGTNTLRFAGGGAKSLFYGDLATLQNISSNGHITASGNISASGLLFASSSQGNYSDVVVQDLTTGRFYTTSSAALSTTLPSGILSSSTQIASDISGSWQGQNFISSSGEIAADISGSWQGQNFISSSGEIAADISGSWQGQNFISSSQTFLSTGQRSGDSAITGSLTVTGTLTAQEFHTEFVSSSIIFSSGSTQFGDTLDDTHTFVGNITASGNISASGNIKAGLSSNTTSNTVFYDNATGELSYGTAASSFTPAGISGSWQGQNFISASQTFLSTGQRSGDSAITGSLEVIGGNLTLGEDGDGYVFRAHGNSNGVNISFNDNSSDMLKLTDNTKLGIGIHGSTSTADLEISHNGTDTIIENKTGNLLISASSNERIEFIGNITASGNVSASGKLYGGLTNTNQSNLVFYNPTDGELTYAASSSFLSGLISSSAQIATDISGAIDAATGSVLNDYSLLSGSNQIAADISGSWQGQNFISASQTFLSTGQRNGDSAITGSFEVTSDITGSNRLLIQKSNGQGDPEAGDSDVAIFQNNDNSQNASIAIIAADTHKSQLHFGKHDDIDIGSIKYLHEGNSQPDQFKFKVNGQNVVTFNNISGRGRIGVGADFTPTDYFHAQGTLSGGGLTVSSSNGGTILLKAANTRAILDRTATDKKLNLEFNTAGTTNWTLGNISESNDNFYIYNGDGQTDKHISLTSDSTTFHTNVTASNNISASGTLNAGLTNTNNSNLVFYNTVGGELTYATTSSFLGGLISSSNQIATDISGAIDAATGSVLNDYGLLSGSNQIAADISGSWQGQNFISASQTFLSTGQRSGDSAITGSFEVTADITASGNISSSGAIRANDYGVDGYLALNTDGSTQGRVFGDASITGIQIGRNGTSNKNIELLGPVTASGDISSSGTNTAHTFLATGNDANLALYGTSDHQNITGSNKILLTSPKFEFGANNISDAGQTSFMFINGTVKTKSHITASGNIQSSGQISASGLLFASSSQGNFSDIVVQDLTTGRFYTTASSAIATTDTFKITGQRSGDSAITGSLTVTGTITAQEFHTEFISSSIIFESGSTQFGNSSDDIHTFSGSINVKDEGHITASGNISASGGTITANNINLDGHVIAGGAVSASLQLYGNEAIIAGNISSSGRLFADLTTGTDNDLVYYNIASGELKHGTIASLTNTAVFAQAVSGAFIGTSASIAEDIATNVTNIQTVSSGVSDNTSLINANTTLINALPTAASVSGSFLLNTTDTLTGNLTVTGAITSSRIASTTNLILNSDADNNSGGALDNIIFQTHGAERMRISGSGRVGIGTALPDKKLVVAKGVTGDAAISASGELYISASVGSYSDILVYSGIDNGGRVYQTPITNLDTFKNTGQRSGDSAITGALEVTGNISASDGIYLPQMTPIIFDSPDTFIRANSGGNESLQIFADVDIQLKPDNDLELYENNDLWTIFKGAERELVVEGSIHADGSGGHITSSGNISASGDITANNFIVGENEGSIRFRASNGNLFTNIVTNNVDDFIVQNLKNNENLRLRAGQAANKGKVLIQQGGTDTNIAEFGKEDTILFNANITSSGNISASGTLFGDYLEVNSPGSIVTGQVGLFKSTTDDQQAYLKIDSANDGTATHAYVYFNEGGSGRGAVGYHAGGDDLRMVFANGIASTKGIIVQNDGKVGIGTSTPGEALEVIGNISASGTLSAGLAQESGSNVVYYNTSSGLFTFENLNPPIDKVRFSGLNDGNTTVNDDGGSTAEFTLSGSSTLGIKVRGHAATSTIGIELHTVGIPEITNFDGVGSNISTDADSFVIHDVSAGVVKRTLAENIDVSAFNNDAGYTNNTGDITGVTAGTGLNGGGGGPGNVTLNIDYSGTDNFIGAAAVATGAQIPQTTDNIVFEDRTNTDTVRQINFGDVPLSIFTNNIDGTFLSVDTSNNLDFTPGGTANGVITSNGASGATVESNLKFDGDLKVISGDVIAFFQSDKRLKDNVTPITNPISKIMKIGGYTFDWNEKQDTYEGHDVGVMAQEVEKVLPEVVETRENGYKAVKYDKMVPLLIEAIKDQQKQIDELKKLIK